MIHFDRSLAPRGFNAEVRAPGLDALREMRGEKPLRRRPGPKRKKLANITGDDLPAFWTRCLNRLARAFRDTCAYSSFHLHSVTGGRTVDHFEPKTLKKNFKRAYSWKNFRYSSLTMNRRKGTAVVCNPFRVRDHWFFVNFADYSLYANPALPRVVRDLIDDTIQTLQLNVDTHCVISRRLSGETYFTNPSRANFVAMRKDCPLVAKEAVRQKLVAAAHLPLGGTVSQRGAWRVGW